VRGERGEVTNDFTAEDAEVFAAGAEEKLSLLFLRDNLGALCG
jgi:hypothetical protein